MNEIIKRLKSKTYRVALLMGALGVLEAHFQVILPLIPEAYRGFAPMIMALVMMYMREVTKEPLSEK